MAARRKPTGKAVAARDRGARRSVHRIALFLSYAFHYDRQVLKGILAYAAEKPDWSLVRSMGMPAIDGAYYGKVEADGMIVHTDPPIVDKAVIPGVSIVGVSENWRVAGMHMVVNDDEETGRMVARHLLAKGFQHFAFKGMLDRAFSQHRRDGFVEELARSGHTDVPTLLLKRSYLRARSMPDRVRRIIRWLEPLPRPIAIMACHDLDAIEVAEACDIMGLRIPDEVAITGVDNDPFVTELTNPPLTSVQQATFRIGYEAARRLDQLLSGKAPKDPVLRIPPERLVVRASSEIQAVADPLVSHALALIHANPETIRTVAELARHAGASRSLLDRRFRECLGRTAFSEIQRTRLDRARHLLATTRWSLTNIAYACGFADLKDFSTFFKRHTGQRPSAYRRNSGGGKHSEAQK